MNISPNDIVLKPTLQYWFIRNVFFILVTIVLIITSSTIRDYTPLRYGGAIVALFMTGIICYRYIYMLLFTKWIVTDDQIYIIEGVIVKTTDYIELYRVTDYQEKQSIIERLFNITTLYIYSGDKSHGILRISGVKQDPALIGRIRSRVEVQKKMKSIYEFTNR